MATKRSEERRARAAEICQTALRFLEDHGKWDKMKRGGEVLQADTDDFMMLLKPPVEGMPPLGQDLRRQLVDSGREIPLEYRFSLNVWLRAGGKVLLMNWEEGRDSEFEITTFKRGDWEDAVLGLAPLH